MNPNFSKEVRELFLENYENIFRRHLSSKFTDEYFDQRNFVRIKLSGIKGIYLDEVEISKQAKYDMNVGVYIQYKHYYRFDKESDSWLLSNVPDNDTRVLIKKLKAIFRNEVFNTYGTIITMMKKNDINAIFLKKYSGGISEKEFLNKLKEAGLFAEFVRD